MKEVVIIGGGITGLSVAWRLINKGFKVKILESDSRVVLCYFTIKYFTL